MRSCLALIAIVLIAGFLLKTCVSEKPLEAFLESADSIPPVEVSHERRAWFLNLGHSGYLKFVNKSGKSAVITEAKVVRADGTVKKLEGAPALVKANDVAEMKLMNGMFDFQPVPGDRIDIYFEGYTRPKGIKFE